MTDASSQPVLRLAHITKRFGSLVANDDISLSLGRGEVLALLGENGAGKSTLVSILFGHYVADEGEIEVFGQPLPPGQPKAALAAGIGMVHQHFTLADNLSVLDNLMMGTEPLFQPFSRQRAAREKVRETAQRFGLMVDTEARVADLSVGERQRVEILKALVRGARILILDEPTAVLTPQESESLFATLRELVAQGLSIIFISHKLDEVLRVSHQIAVLRGGKLVATRPAEGTSKAELAELMVGRSVAMPKRESRPAGDVVLSVHGLRVDAASGGKPLLDGVNLAIRSGEILGIAGVSGNGQVPLAHVLSGLLAADSGVIDVAGQRMKDAPRQWVEAGVARIPEDRHALGVVGDLPVWENAVTEPIRSPSLSRWGWIKRGAAKKQAQALVKRFDVRLSGIDAAARSLSGGNMQKLIVGRALSVRQTPGREDDQTPPVLIVAAQPTWGLDIGAVAYVHRCLLDACEQGSAVLLISEDLDELFALSDRIAVMHHGHLGEARATADWTLADIGLAMAGSRHQENAHAA